MQEMENKGWVVGFFQMVGNRERSSHNLLEFMWTRRGYRELNRS